MKHFIKRISTVLIIVLLLQISLFGQDHILKPIEAASSGPIIVSKSPADDQVGVSINRTLSFTFDEPIKKGNGSAQIAIYNAQTNAVFESLDIISPNVAISGDGRTVNIHLSEHFENNTDYYVLIDAGAFANVSNGSSLSGILNVADWNFKTIAAGDVAPPTGTLNINDSALYTNSTNVSLNISAVNYNNEQIEMSFSNDNLTWSNWEPLSLKIDWNLSAGDGAKKVYMRLKDSTGRLSVTSSYSIILDTASPVVTGITNGGTYNNNITISFDEGTAVLNGNPFTSGSTVSAEGNYTLLVTDAAGNQTTVNFTIDKTIPRVTSLFPGNNAVINQLNANLEINFDEPVFVSTGNIEIRHVANNVLFRSIPVTSDNITGGGTTKITINPNKSLYSGDSNKSFVNNSQYYVVIGNRAIRDAAGNYFSGDIVGNWTFQVKEDVLIRSKTPKDNMINVPITKPLSIEFEKSIKANAGKYIHLVRVQDNVSEKVEATDILKVSIQDKTVTITPPQMLENTSYYVLIDAGAFSETDNTTSFAGITDKTTWNFKTAKVDSSPPQVISLLPRHNAVIDQLNANLEINFNEPVFPLAGNIEIRNVVNDELLRSIPVNSAEITGAGTTKITIKSDSNKPFVNNKQYYVSIGNRVIRDAAGNYFTGIQSNSWTFQVKRKESDGENNTGTETDNGWTNTSLSQLNMSVNGVLIPIMNTGTNNYRGETEANQVEIFAIPASQSAKIIWNGKKFTNSLVVDLQKGDNLFELVVQAGNGTKQIYTITIHRKVEKERGCRIRHYKLLCKSSEQTEKNENTLTRRKNISILLKSIE